MPTTTVIRPEPFEPWDDCVCGRKMGQVHCPFCGSFNSRAVPSKAHETTLPNGDVIINKLYNCRKCGDYFDTRARMDCRAPAPSVSRRDQAKTAANLPKTVSLDNMSPEVLAKLAELRKKYQGE